MPKATEAPTTLAATTLPPVIDLGRRIAALEREHERQDQIVLEARKNSVEEDAARNAMAILNPQAEALRELIATVPGRTMADAAVQVAQAFLLAEDLRCNETPPGKVERHAEALCRLLLSVLPIAVTAAGLDAVEMGWQEDLGALRSARFAGLEGVV